MKILFLTIARITGISERGIYTDLMRKFRDEGHDVFIASPTERRYQEETGVKNADGVTILNIRTLNAQKTSLLEKGICTLLIDGQFTRAINKYYGKIHFDLILYSTPPITFTKTISILKKRNQAVTYLLLKDIFPQNAVDLGMMSKKGLIHAFFRNKEKKLYAVSDFIGCLSPANIHYLLENNSEIDPEIVEENPNTILPVEGTKTQEERAMVRAKYNIPENDVVFLYGGNLGKPQGIPFLIDVLKSNMNVPGVFFFVVGSGTELDHLLEWQHQMKPSNILIREGLPKNEYDLLVKACDVGLIFLDKRFTIPNFPSRLLSYLENRMPVLAATDVNTDIGKIIEEAGCGFWVESGEIEGFNGAVGKLINTPEIITKMGDNGFDLLNQKYTVDRSFSIIMNHLKDV